MFSCQCNEFRVVFFSRFVPNCPSLDIISQPACVCRLCDVHQYMCGPNENLTQSCFVRRGRIPGRKRVQESENHTEKSPICCLVGVSKRLSPAQNAMDPSASDVTLFPSDIPTKHCSSLCKSERPRPFLCFCKLQRLHAQLQVHKYLLTCIKKEEFRDKKKRSTHHTIFTILD